MAAAAAIATSLRAAVSGVFMGRLAKVADEDCHSR
jgi:hypothetical protein